MGHLSLITTEKGRVYHYCFSSNNNPVILGISEAMIISNSIKEQARIKADEVLSSKWLSPALSSQHEKESGEILSCLDKRKGSNLILIEGIPGIGKTTLVNEMCYQWANGEVLQYYRFVFLLQLQDPALKEMSKITYLLQLLCQRGTEFSKVSSACVCHLFNNYGKDILFVFDGYDEFCRSFPENSSNVIVDILNQKALPQCSIVMTSRPCASIIFSRKITRKINILGFTRDEVESYIQAAMPSEPHRISNLMNYIARQPVIDCFVPFNMAILVYLYQHGSSLPRNSAELYHSFICLTVCRHLAKCGIRDITKLTDLPEPYYRRIQQLAKLSYETFYKNWSFSRDQIEIACPNINGIDDEHGLQHCGLLQEVKHISNNTTFNFIHVSIQQYLAAWYLSTLQSIELELRFLKENFWKDNYFKVFSMYVALTKGQRPSFKKFLSGDEKISISCEYLKDQLKCLRLFHCFHEAGDTKLCRYLERSQTFKDQAIELSSINLSVIDIECIAVFLASSFQKEWHELNLNNCGIGDHGLYMLHRGLLASNITSITMLQLSYNGLTKVSLSLVSDIVVNCNVKKLKIDGNYSIGENDQYTMLNNVSKLEYLHLVNTKLSSIGLNSICEALINNRTLKELVVTDNNITDDACSAIITALQNNSWLVKLWMWRNPIHSNTLTLILKALQVNNTLAFLGLPSCSEVTKMALESQQEVVNKERKNRGCQVKLVIDFM